jgi:hypothetical protein
MCCVLCGLHRGGIARLSVLISFPDMFATPLLNDERWRSQPSPPLAFHQTPILVARMLVVLVPIARSGPFRKSSVGI